MFSQIITLSFISYFIYAIYNLWLLVQLPTCDNEQLCLYSYLRTSPKLKIFLFTSVNRNPPPNEVTLIITKSAFKYNETFTREIEIPIPYETRKNGTLYVHVFVSELTSNWFELVRDINTVHVTTQLTRYMVPDKWKYHLLSNSSAHKKKIRSTTHLKKVVSFFMLIDDVTFKRTEVPSEFYSLLRIKRNEYMPIVMDNYLLDQTSIYEELNDDQKFVKVSFVYKPLGYGYFRFLLHFYASLESVRKFGFQDKDIDELKSVITNTNTYFLILTAIVTSLHLLFDFLAFKNDISFWYSRKSWAGLSLRTVLWRTFSQMVICLYLYDENASLLVLIPSIIGLFIEIWKVQRMIPIDWLRLRFKVVKVSAIEQQTREFDAQIMHYLSFLLYPLCVAGAIYSLLYQSHRSWYSWVIHNLVYAVYCFDFLFMVPQLFVNYKLKSVAHLPWKTFMYKAFNTFIDDLFAFIVVMPTASRIACLRDDVVFIIYIIQRWIYPVDKSRIDEDVSEKENVALKKKKQ